MVRDRDWDLSAKVYPRQQYQTVRLPSGAVRYDRIKRGALRIGKLYSDVAVFRTGAVGKRAFEACIDIGRYRGSSHSIKRASGYTTSCMFGQNPRVALASALARASRQMRKRTGAFAGYAFGSPKGRSHRGYKRRGRRLGR